MTKSVHEMSASARQVETVDGTGVPAVPNVLGTPDSRFSGRERSVDPANAGKQVRPAGSCGYLHVYTGDGKGKTTAAFGLAVRALCAGQSVYIGQFVKSMRYNETKIEGIFDRMRIEQLGRGCFIGHDPEPADVGMAREGLARCRALLVSGEYDLVLLDIMLPVMDGWSVCAHIREKAKTPIIMLTAKSEVNDRITGLEMGADDYLVKPFEMKELMARINAVLRRSEIPDDTRKRLVFDKLEINLDSYELLVDGKKVDTPPKELELLYHLASTPNRVYTRNQLLDEVWGFDYFGDSRTVDVHIKRLREKIENVSDQWELKTVWGVGYKFEVK